MDAEVLVYVQKVKNYLETNQEAREYFIGDANAEEFYTHLKLISEKNFEENGEPELSKEQFELLRKTITAVAISKQKVFYSDDKVFMFYEDYPPICMN
jgi:hypothetical protein